MFTTHRAKPEVNKQLTSCLTGSKQTSELWRMAPPDVVLAEPEIVLGAIKDEGVDDCSVSLLSLEVVEAGCVT